MTVPVAWPHHRCPGTTLLAAIESIDSALIARAGDASARLGIAVSGGPDSLALAAARRRGRAGPGRGGHRRSWLRAGSRAEARSGRRSLCERLGVPHAHPDARNGREARDRDPGAGADRALSLARRLGARSAGLGALATAHHADDQAETLLMRLARVAPGFAGLPACGRSRLARDDVRLLRPLLGWRRSELDAICRCGRRGAGRRSQQ